MVPCRSAMYEEVVGYLLDRGICILMQVFNTIHNDMAFTMFWIVSNSGSSLVLALPFICNQEICHAINSKLILFLFKGT